MAKIPNTRKVFNVRIEILGFDQFEAQSIEIPDWEIDVVAHGDTNHDAKTAGRIKFGNIKMEKVKPLPTPDNFFLLWMQQIQDAVLGGGDLPINYQQIIIIKEMDTTGLFPINQWMCTEAWPCKMSQAKFDRMSSDNVIQSIEFAVEKVIPI